MLDSLPHSNPSSCSLSSSSSASESFCFLTSYSDSDFDAPDVQLTLSDKPTLDSKPNPISKPDTTIYSFACSKSLEHTENPKHQQNLSREKYGVVNAPVKSWAMSTSGFSGSVVSKLPPAAKVDIRTLPPTLPRPIYWSALTQPELFKEYMASEGLTTRSLDEPSITTEDEALPEPFQKPYSNIQSITIANSDKEKIIYNCSTTWLDDHLFANNKLPAPFVPSLLSSDTTLWKTIRLGETGNHTFANLPNLADVRETVKWLNHLGNCLGILHGLVAPSSSSDPNQTRKVVKDCEDRAFDCEGSHKPLAKGLIKRKPGIVVIDRSLRHHVPTAVRLRWPLVQALVEITSQNEQPQSELINTMLDKASKMFDSQLHRRYVVGLALMGKGERMQFFFVLIDRTGAACTEPTHISGYGAMTLARIIYGLTFGNARVLGADPKVSIDCLTGDPQVVVVDNQRFTVITEIYASPFLFGRGTRVHIVKDQHGRFHILKDSWILATHKDSEIDHIKNISNKVQTEGLDERSQILSPRFVAGENHVDDTDEPRGLLSKNAIARIRRRIVTGPIGDPITTYHSRVECLQALIDVVDQLKFLHDKCGLVHGDISISNVVIVRFLPGIVAALQPHSSSLSLASAFTTVAQAPSPTAGEQLADSPSSSLVNSPTTTTISPSIGLSQLLPSVSDDKKNLPLSWETLKPCTTSGFPYHLDSGGSVIDFDYSRAKNTLSAKTSGTMPYMAIELMAPTEPLVHEPRHDLESVFFVLLHIACFTCGPAGTSIGEMKVSHRVAQWHHERMIEAMKDEKMIDIAYVYFSPAERLTDYWVPIAPYIQELIKVVYGGVPSYGSKSQATFEPFKDVLTRALNHCRTLSEITPNYAAVQPPVTGRKRPRTKSTAKDCPAPKLLRTLKEDMPIKLPRDTHIVPFPQYQDSDPLESEY